MKKEQDYNYVLNREYVYREESDDENDFSILTKIEKKDIKREENLNNRKQSNLSKGII